MLRPGSMVTRASTAALATATVVRASNGAFRVSRDQ